MEVSNAEAEKLSDVFGVGADLLSGLAPTRHIPIKRKAASR